MGRGSTVVLYYSIMPHQLRRFNAVAVSKPHRPLTGSGGVEWGRGTQIIILMLGARILLVGLRSCVQ
ncbi:hypothetical protein B0T26DRAFT_716806 [Lasiosphaeria miniovina]|uniref:Uncharacterized protein n=1 Tax=Lasiosphaeria miniovina TaxID=1954250 RepID=A0AA40DRU4_9PEZI|nr:uncharacterized protein B0T26DRAFT_716806 [Lasiosphaeria miniovina]KAK0713225.1 hypothetical protein B0T26DRAFT_716806 [Lasiosphaeria miniovina]